MGIGENIRNNRKNKGLTQKELGLMIGISASTVTKYEKEDLEPNIETLNKIAEALGVSQHELITGESLFNESETLTQSLNAENIDPHLKGDLSKIGLAIQPVLNLINDLIKDDPDIDWDKIKGLTSSEMNDIVTYNASFAKMIILKRKASDIPDSEIAMHINIKNK